MKGLLQDKVAVVTGAAQGIGKSTAILFARQSAIVYAIDINDIDWTTNMDLGGKIIPIKIDICDFSAVKNVVLSN